MNNNILKWYDIINIKQEFFTPIIDIAKDGIVTVVSNLQLLRAGSIFKECFELKELASTINRYVYSSAEILTLTNNNIFLLYIVAYIISVLLIKKLSNFLENNHSNKKANPIVLKPLSEEDKKSSSSDNNNPNPKGNDTGILAGIVAFMDQHQKALTLIILGTILVSGTYLVLNHYGMIPNILDILRKTDKELYIDPITNNSTFCDLEVLVKLDIIYGELTLHKNEICITNLTSTSLKPSEFLAVLRQYPKETRDAVMSIIKEISEKPMTEAEIVKSIPTDYLDIFHNLLISLYNSKKK